LATNGQAYADSVSKTNQAASQQAETAAAQTNKDTGDALGGLSKLLTSGISAFGLGRGQSSYSAPASQDPVHIGPTDMDLIPHTIMTT
jgi:hypothetical protein